MDLRTAARNLARQEYARVQKSSKDWRDRKYLLKHPVPVREATVLVHFADAEPNLYQLRQWYEPLEALNEVMPVAIGVRQASIARIVRQESPLPVVYLRTLDDVESYLTRVDPRVVFYVNQAMRNFLLMRYSRAMHVFISHGESEKSYMVSGQIRAYDFSFIAGQAALERLQGALPNYDAERWTRQIGRPQLDFLSPDRSGKGPVRTVLYAPTCEGDRKSMGYGSIESHGRQIVRSLLDSGYRVIYRPHPLSGTQQASYRQADLQIRSILEAANRGLPAGREPHVIDTAGRLDLQIAQSDVAIVDNSAMAFDWLVTGKPLIVTIPRSESVTGVHTGFLSSCYRLSEAQAGEAGQMVGEVLRDDRLHDQRNFWIQRHFGDISPGASTKRFLDATREVADFGLARIAETEAEAKRLAEANAAR